MSDFEQARDTFREASESFYQGETDAIDSKFEAAKCKRTIAEFEADIIVMGIEGKNPEVRAAQLVVTCKASPAWVLATQEQRKHALAAARAEAFRDDAANRMSLARQEMDYAIAITNRATAAVSGNGVER